MLGLSTLLLIPARSAAPAAALYPHADGSGVPTCTKCGQRSANGKMAALNCCSDGGTWEGLCDGDQHKYVASDGSEHAHTHTWHEGYLACQLSQQEDLKPALHRRPALEVLGEAFLNGVASNDLTKVGLIFHGFDQTGDEWAPYKPCTTGYCKRYSTWWPTSIINARQMHVFGGVGILFEPVRTCCFEPHVSDLTERSLWCATE